MRPLFAFGWARDEHKAQALAFGAAVFAVMIRDLGWPMQAGKQPLRVVPPPPARVALPCENLPAFWRPEFAGDVKFLLTRNSPLSVDILPCECGKLAVAQPGKMAIVHMKRRWPSNAITN